MNSNEKQQIDKQQLIDNLVDFGIKPGMLLNMKVSLSSIGFVIGGASTLVDALIEVVGKDGTIMSDAFLSVYPIPLNTRDRKKISDVQSPSYAGAFANAMVQHPSMERSRHPIQRFVAIGRNARELMRNHTPDKNAYDPLRVLTEIGGLNLKIGSDEKVVGVGTTHVAIQLMGFKQIRSRAGLNYRDENGNIKTFERNWAGGCDVGFGNYSKLYERNNAVIKKGNIGNSPAKLTDMKKTLEVELEEMRKDPSSFLCDRSSCYQCRKTWPFSYGDYVPIKEDGTKIESIVKKLIKKLV